MSAAATDASEMMAEAQLGSVIFVYKKKKGAEAVGFFYFCFFISVARKIGLPTELGQLNQMP
jgi:hypothetical protein